MTYTITVTFDSDAPQDRIVEIADRMVVQLEDLDDPDQGPGGLVDADTPEIPAYDYGNVKTIVNGEQI
jgi:hypothetical protein